MSTSEKNYVQRISIYTYKQISKFYYPKLKFGRISKKIIELLILQNQSRKEICVTMNSFFQINRDYVRHFIWHMKTKGLIVENQSKLELTQFGKFAFLMCKYKINFIQLCFLLETFYCQNRMLKNGCRVGFYGILYFVDKVDDVFTTQYVRWSVSHLVRKKLIYRHHKGAFSIVPKIFNDLMSYDEIINSFHMWFIETWRKKRKIVLLDPHVIQRQHEYAELCHKIIL
jgi:hypothetical protein